MNTRQAKSSSLNQKLFGILLVAVSLFFFLSVIGALGGVGRMVADFAVGFFGLAVYAYSVVGVLVGVALILSFKFSPTVRRLVIGLGILFCLIYGLQAFSSTSHFQGANYTDYLLACYDNTNTAGGMLYGISVYPIMKLITPVGALSLAGALMCALILVALVPLVKKNVVYNVPDTTKRRKRKSVVVDVAGQSMTKVDRAKNPTLTNFSKNNIAFYPLKIDGALSPNFSRSILGADGYVSLVESHKINLSNQNADFFEDEFNSSNYAKDLLFSANPKPDSMRNFGLSMSPAKSNSKIASNFGTVKRAELRAKLGMDATNADIKESFSQKYNLSKKTGDKVDLVDADSLDQMPNTQKVVKATKESIFAEPSVQIKKDKAPEFKLDFDQMKKDQKRFVEESLREKEEKRKANEQILTAKSYDTPKDKDNVLQAETVDTDYARKIPYGNEVPKSERDVSKMIRNDNARHQERQAVKPDNMAGLRGQVARATESKPAFLGNSEDNIPRAFQGMKADKIVFGEDEQNGSQVYNQKNIQNKKDANPNLGPNNSQSQRQNIAQNGNQNPRQNSSQNNQDINQNNQRAGLKNEYVMDGLRDASHGVQPQRQQVVESQPQSKMASSARSSADDLKMKKMAREAGKQAPAKSAYEVELDRAEQRQKKMKSDIRKASKGADIDSTKERLTQVNMDQAISQTKRRVPYIAPPLSLLIPPEKEIDQQEDYGYKKQVLVDTFNFFDVKAEVENIEVGSTFSLYTCKVEMPRGRSVGSLTNLENDIAMRMEEESVRILAPIPGKNAIGIEIPNKFKRMVRLSEILGSQVFNTAKSPATFALGKNLYGVDTVCDVGALPHMLIAGATGAGKSCCINSVIISLIYKASPEDVRLILVDPKRVELSVYEGLPHLLLDEIICDVDKAIKALNWAIGEMTRRIGYLEKLKYRNIDEYNADCEKHGYDKMPRIVIIVDELADLMSMGKRAVEDAINRLARLARATGIHMLLATQRPSVDVVSGTIKNNLPSRAAFRVTAGPDSRTILDAVGAEKLLGNGDMLYMSPKANLLQRMQGAFISNEEVQRVVDFVKENNQCNFDDSIKDAIFKDKEEEAKSKNKEKSEGGITQEIVDALRVGVEGGAMSISNIQCRLGFGWPRASRVIATLEDMGLLIEDENDRKKKRVNLTLEEFKELEKQVQEDE